MHMKNSMFSMLAFCISTDLKVKLSTDRWNDPNSKTRLNLNQN